MNNAKLRINPFPFELMGQQIFPPNAEQKHFLKQKNSNITTMFDQKKFILSQKKFRSKKRAKPKNILPKNLF